MTIYDHENVAGGTLLSPLLPSPCRCRPHQLLLPLVVVLAIQADLASWCHSTNLRVWRFGSKDWDPFSNHNRLQRLSCKMLQVLRCFWHLRHDILSTSLCKQQKKVTALCFAVAPVAEAEPRPWSLLHLWISLIYSIFYLIVQLLRSSTMYSVRLGCWFSEVSLLGSSFLCWPYHVVTHSQFKAGSKSNRAINDMSTTYQYITHAHTRIVWLGHLKALFQLSKMRTLWQCIDRADLRSEC